MKYGVICKTLFLNDLHRWTNLYAAGRLHKPVNVIKDSPEVVEAMAVNKRHAVCTSLLLLPQRYCHTMFDRFYLWLGDVYCVLEVCTYMKLPIYISVCVHYSFGIIYTLLLYSNIQIGMYVYVWIYVEVNSTEVCNTKQVHMHCKYSVQRKVQHSISQ